MSKSSILFVVSNAELLFVNNKNQLIELNEKLDREIIHFNYLNASIDIIAYESQRFFQLISSVVFYRQKLQLDCEELVKVDNIEKQLADIQISINELEAWHSRTSNCHRQRKIFIRHICFL